MLTNALVMKVGMGSSALFLCAGRAAVIKMGFVTSHSSAIVDLVGRANTVTPALRILAVNMEDV